MEWLTSARNIPELLKGKPHTITQRNTINAMNLDTTLLRKAIVLYLQSDVHNTYTTDFQKDLNLGGTGKCLIC